MRAKEFINEVTNPDIHDNQFNHQQEIGDYLYTAKTDNNSGYGNQLIIKVYDGRKEIGFVEFVEEPEDKVLISGNTWVHKNYREQGIATTMYAYAKMLGNDIVPSWDQTDQGSRMWQSWNQAKQSKHILPRGHKGYHEVNEAFTAPYPMTWEHNDESHDALVKLPDGSNLSIMFSIDYGAYGDEEWAVEFWRNNSQDVTGEGDAQRIFSTVLSAIQQFINEYSPERIRFSATKETDDGQANRSRATLYTSLVKRYARAWGYRADVSDHGSSVVYELSQFN